MANKNAIPPPPGPGRPKGVPNKLTMEVKEMVRGALDALGGQEYLTKQGRDNPNAFLTLVGKVIPTELAGSFKTDVMINVVEFKKEMLE